MINTLSMISISSVLSTTIHGCWFGSKKLINNVDDFNSTQKNDVAPGPSERNVLFPRPIYHNLYKKHMRTFSKMSKFGEVMVQVRLAMATNTIGAIEGKLTN